MIVSRNKSPADPRRFSSTVQAWRRRTSFPELLMTSSPLEASEDTLWSAAAISNGAFKATSVGTPTFPTRSEGYTTLAGCMASERDGICRVMISRSGTLLQIIQGLGLFSIGPKLR